MGLTLVTSQELLITLIQMLCSNLLLLLLEVFFLDKN